MTQHQYSHHFMAEAVSSSLWTASVAILWRNP